MARLSSRILQPLIHVGVWLCLFFYPFLFHYLAIDDFSAVLRIALFLLLLIVFFYTNTQILIPRLLGKKKVVLYLLCVVLFITAITYASGYIQMLFNPEFGRKPMLYGLARNTGVFASFLVWVISSVMKITGEWYRNEQLRRSSEHERLKSELSFLKTQVNPHFLFNALNNIYALEQRKSPHTGDAILRLSELARYMLYETAAETVPLEREVEYLKGYIELQKLGLDDIKVSFTVTGDIDGLKIEPMLLVPLVENAFKHGVSYMNRQPIDISLSLNRDELIFKVENGFDERLSVNDRTSGIGLSNLEKRLRMLYPGNYSLLTENKNSKFMATLKLTLKHDQMHRS